jgi:hypothetical protein
MGKTKKERKREEIFETIMFENSSKPKPQIWEI